MKLYPKTVEGRMLLLVLVICLSMCLLAARLILMSQEDAILGANFSRLDADLERAHSELARNVESRERHATALAESLRKAFLETGAASGADPIRETLASCDEILDIDFDAVHVLTRQSTDLVSNVPVGPSTEERVQTLYREAIDANHPFDTPRWTFNFHAANGEGLLSVLIPVEDARTPLIAVVGDIKLERFAGGLHDEENPRFGELVIFDSDGRRIPVDGLPNTSEVMKRVIERLRNDAGSSDRSVVDVNGAQYHAALRRIEGPGWTVATLVDSSTLYRELRWAQTRLALSAVVVALILVLLLRATFRQLFIDRVVALERATRNFSQHGIIHLPPTNNDEVGKLIHAFDEMVNSLSSREAELTLRNQQLKNEISGRLSAVESLRESERKFRTLFDKSSDAVLVYDGERYIDCNEAAVSMFGFGSKAELLMADPNELLPETQPSGDASIEFTRTKMDIARKHGDHRCEWVCRRQDGQELWVEVVLTLIPYGGREVLYTVWRDISDRKAEEEERVRLTTALEQAAEAIMVTAADGTIVYVNPSFEDITQYPRESALGMPLSMIHDESQDGGVAADLAKAMKKGRTWKGRIKNRRRDGTSYQAETTISPVRDATGAIINYVVVSYDVTKEATLEAQLIQAQKMEAIGELASGIAHEINTPTQYIGDNIRFFQESFNDIRTLLDEYERLLEASRSLKSLTDAAGQIDTKKEEIELEFLLDEIPLAITQSLEGNSRVAEIVRAMKEFGHPGLEERTAIDINHAIENTLAVARNEWKYVADIDLQFDPSLPDVPCLPGSFNQVILNIIVNASHAIGDVVGDGASGKGRITIATAVVDECAEIRIHDTGAGIPEEIRSKIFDPFFTTKGVGKGTGQGLALVHSVIVEKHGGTIEVESEIGVGTTFIIRVPLAEAMPEPDTAEIVEATMNG